MACFHSNRIIFCLVFVIVLVLLSTTSNAQKPNPSPAKVVVASAFRWGANDQPRCLPLPKQSFCYGVVPYQKTRFPNLVNQTDPQEALESLETFRQLLDSQCAQYLRHFLCSVYLPMCIEDVSLVTPGATEQQESATSHGAFDGRQYNNGGGGAEEEADFVSPFGAMLEEGEDEDEIDESHHGTMSAWNNDNNNNGRDASGGRQYERRHNSARSRRRRQVAVEQQQQRSNEVHSSASASSLPLTSTADNGHILLPPCRVLCEHARSKCEPIIKAFAKLSWPPELACSRFPERNEGESMCVDYNLRQQQNAAGATLSPTSSESDPFDKLINTLHKNQNQKSAAEAKPKNVIDEIVEKARNSVIPSTTTKPADIASDSRQKPTSIFSSTNTQQLCVNLDSDLRRAAFRTPSNFGPIAIGQRQLGTLTTPQSLLCVQSCNSDIRYESHQKWTSQVCLIMFVSCVFCCSALSFLALVCKAQTSALSYGSSSSAVTSPISTLKVTPTATYDPVTGTTLLINGTNPAVISQQHQNGHWLNQPTRRRATRLPDIVRYVALCILLVCVGHVIRLAGGRSGGCAVHTSLAMVNGQNSIDLSSSPLQLVVPKPAMPFLITSNDWTSSNTDADELDYGGRCVISFVFTQYFTAAANFWLLMLALACILERQLITNSQRQPHFSLVQTATLAERLMRRSWWQIHVLVWTLSAAPIVYGFYNHALDSEELLATCGLGQTNANILLKSTIVPYTIITVLAIILTVTGFADGTSRSTFCFPKIFVRCFGVRWQSQPQSTAYNQSNSSSSQSYASSCSAGSSSSASGGNTVSAGRLRQQSGNSNHYAAPDMPPFHVATQQTSVGGQAQQAAMSYDERRFRKYRSLSLFLLVVWIFSVLGMTIVTVLHYNLLSGQEPQLLRAKVSDDSVRKMLPYDAVKPWPAATAQVLLLLRVFFSIGFGLALPLFSINCLAAPIERCMRSALNRQQRSTRPNTLHTTGEQLQLNAAGTFVVANASGEPVSPSSFVMKRPMTTGGEVIVTSNGPSNTFAGFNSTASAAAAEMLPFTPASFGRTRPNGTFAAPPNSSQLHYPSLASSYTNNITQPSAAAFVDASQQLPLQSFTMWQQMLQAAAKNNTLPATTAAAIMPSTSNFNAPEQATSLYANQHSQQQQRRQSPRQQANVHAQYQQRQPNANLYSDRQTGGSSNHNYCSDDCCSDSNDGSTTCHSNNGGGGCGGRRLLHSPTSSCSSATPQRQAQQRLRDKHAASQFSGRNLRANNASAVVQPLSNSMAYALPVSN